MASTNQSPFYQRAEQEYLEAKSDEDRISCLEIMIKECPKHKSSENMLKNLKNRLKKLKSQVVKQKKSGKSNQQGIKKADMQCILIGFPNSGKTTLFNKLTNLNEKTSPYPFTTYESRPGTFFFEDAPIQIIDSPSFPNHDRGMINSTDTLILIINNLDQIQESEKFTYRSNAKIILVLNQIQESEKRKTEATLRSKFKNYDYIFLDLKNFKINELKNFKRSIFETFPIIRVYTKEPKKEASKDPMILKKDSTIKQAAQKISKEMLKKIKEAKIWGPSSKFPGQTLGLEHTLKDKDIIEFQTK
jgi:ribosome-interacting GTPase 1